MPKITKQGIKIRTEDYNLEKVLKCKHCGTTVIIKPNLKWFVDPLEMDITCPICKKDILHLSIEMLDR